MHTNSLSEASEEPRNAFGRLRRPHGDHVISRNVVRPTSLSLDMQGNHVAWIKWPCGERARPQIDHKLQQRAQICCEKFKCIIMTMICAVDALSDVGSMPNQRTACTPRAWKFSNLSIRFALPADCGGLGKDWQLNSERNEYILVNVLLFTKFF